MVHHEGRPDLFKGAAVKYRENELRDIFKDDKRTVFVFADEKNKVLG